MAINIHTIYKPFLKYFRTKRMIVFQNIMSPETTTTILDVGETGSIWRLASLTPEISILNLAFSDDPQQGIKIVHLICADAVNLPFRDRVYDICYSNSVIEHMATFENRQRFTQELR